jgi:hypothetical protein
MSLWASIYNALPIVTRAFNVLAREQRLNVDVLDSLAIGIATFQGRLFTTTTFVIRLITPSATVSAIRRQPAVAGRKLGQHREDSGCTSLSSDRYCGRDSRSHWQNTRAGMTEAVPVRLDQASEVINRVVLH